MPSGEKPRVIGDMTIRFASVTPRTESGVKSGAVIIPVSVRIVDLRTDNDTPDSCRKKACRPSFRSWARWMHGRGRDLSSRLVLVVGQLIPPRREQQLLNVCGTLLALRGRGWNAHQDFHAAGYERQQVAGGLWRVGDVYRPALSGRRDEGCYRFQHRIHVLQKSLRYIRKAMRFPDTDAGDFDRVRGRHMVRQCAHQDQQCLREVAARLQQLFDPATQIRHAVPDSSAKQVFLGAVLPVNGGLADSRTLGDFFDSGPAEPFCPESLRGCVQEPFAQFGGGVL